MENKLSVTIHPIATRQEQMTAITSKLTIHWKNYCRNSQIHNKGIFWHLCQVESKLVHLAHKCYNQDKCTARNGDSKYGSLSRHFFRFRIS